ncbi:MAG TPA: hypothetical protein VNF73_16960 [Candidatus Saccharimonadales bacterium]|nr:hypothetical protein [Candidatus Saccharimonadales bacterium]
MIKREVERAAPAILAIEPTINRDSSYDEYLKSLDRPREEPPEAT